MAVVWGLSGCAPEPQAEWVEQPAPSGPCYEANLADGLSEDSTDELHDVFDCLNRTGSFDPLAELVDSLDSPTRSGEPAGVDLAHALVALADQDIDALALAGQGVDLLQDESHPVPQLLRVSVELLYGASWTRLSAGDVRLNAESSLDGGALRPLFPSLRFAAGALLDDNLVGAQALGDALASDAAKDLVYTGAAMAESQDRTLQGVLPDLPLHLGQAIERSRDASNDRWSGASGDSMRDIADALFVRTGNDGRMAIEHMADPLRGMLADYGLRGRIRFAVAQLDNGNHLDPLPPQLLYLAQVDAEGGTLQAGEDSALVALLRLLRDANTPMQCSLDLWVTSLDIDLGNLSVSLLETLAQQDPDTVETGVGLLGTVIGWSFSRSTLESIADSGVCPTLDRQMVADLESVDRFNDPETRDLLVALLALLEATYNDGDSHVPELVDVLATAYDFGAAQPLEEVLRDIGTHAIAYDLLELVPVILEPRAYIDESGFPDAIEPVDFEALWNIAEVVFTPRASGRTGVEEVAPALRAVLQQDGTWQAIGHVGALLQSGDAQTGEVAQLLPALVRTDPDLNLLDTLATLVGEPTVVAPLLRVVETPTVLDAAGSAELDAEGPLPFYARLVIGGTLDDALAWVDWIIDLLDDEG